MNDAASGYNSINVVFQTLLMTQAAAVVLFTPTQSSIINFGFGFVLLVISFYSSPEQFFLPKNWKMLTLKTKFWQILTIKL